MECSEVSETSGHGLECFDVEDKSGHVFDETASEASEHSEVDDTSGIGFEGFGCFEEEDQNVTESEQSDVEE